LRLVRLGLICAQRVSPFFMERELRTFQLTEIRADGGNSVSGHAAVFGVRSHDLGFREVIQAGAFADAILRGDDVKFLLNHEGLPLARTKSGTLRLSEDERGLAFRAELDPTDPDAQRLLPKVKRGDLSEMSFAFGIQDRSKDEKWERNGAEMVRTLIRVSLFDVSAVTFPAYPSTDLHARDYFSAKIAELRALPDEQKKHADELERAEFRLRMKERDDFINRRTPRPDPMSFPEIIKRATIKPSI